MSNYRTRDTDVQFFARIFSMLARDDPDDFYGQVQDIARERFPRRVEIGVGPVSEGYSSLGSIVIGPNTAEQILRAKNFNPGKGLPGLLEEAERNFWQDGEMGYVRYLTRREPPLAIKVDVTRDGFFPFAIELKIEKYLDVFKGYEDVDSACQSLDDLELEREAVMIWHVPDPSNEGVLASVIDRRFSE